VVRGHTVDHLGDEHGLAHAGATEQADLAALQVRGERSSTFMPVSNICAFGSRSRTTVPDGGCPSGWTVDVSAATSSGSPITLNTCRGHVADGHGDASTGVVHHGAASQTVGGLQEMARTRLSPMCWATSAVTLVDRRPR
jgi:hypothetical protein